VINHNLSHIGQKIGDTKNVVSFQSTQNQQCVRFWTTLDYFLSKKQSSLRSLYFFATFNPKSDIYYLEKINYNSKEKRCSQTRDLSGSGCMTRPQQLSTELVQLQYLR